MHPKQSNSVRDVLGAASHTLQISTMMGLYMAQASFAKMRIRDPQKRLEYFTKNVTEWTARALKVMNIEVQLVGYKPELFAERNFLMVSNHMSYSDVLIMASIRPCVFVTSVDMQETPLLGDLAEMGGSIFVERRNRGQISQDISQMSKALRQGHNVMIYPEGTSTDGQTILPFKKSLLMSAVEAGRDILPVCLKYLEIDGEPFAPHNAHKVAWYGDMKFAPHFLGMMKLKNVKAQLEFLEPIPVSAHSTRQELAEKSFHAVYQAYMGHEPPAGLVHKPGYQHASSAPASKAKSH